MESLRGQLVVATPMLGDPNFAHSVVFLLDHNDEGALGIVLNRPSGADVASTLPRWDTLALAPEVMFVGGPVQPEAVVALGLADNETEAVQPVVPGVAIVDLRADPLALTDEVQGLRLFAGYAGWGGGQLEVEIDEGDGSSWTPSPMTSSVTTRITSGSACSRARVACSRRSPRIRH